MFADCGIAQGRYCYALLSRVLLVLHLSLPPLRFCNQQQPSPSPIFAQKKSFLLYTYGDGLPAYQKGHPCFFVRHDERGVSTDDIFLEYLDLQRSNGGEYRRKLADLLRYKYAMRQVGLIVTVHTGALEFLLEKGKGLFPDVPVILLFDC